MRGPERPPNCKLVNLRGAVFEPRGRPSSPGSSPMSRGLGRRLNRAEAVDTNGH